MDLADFMLEDSNNDVQKLETEIMTLKNDVEKIRLGDKLEMVEKIDKLKDHLLARETISPITIKLLEEKLAKLVVENCGLKEKVGEIDELKMAIESTNNKFGQQEKKILELEGNLVKLCSENYLMKEEMSDWRMSLKKRIGNSKNWRWIWRKCEKLLVKEM